MIVETGYILALQDCRDTAVAGGKAVNLGHLLCAGFPVPGGFAVTTHAFRPCAAGAMPAEVAAAIGAAYAAMGGGPVAVRSSATAEDMADASMAGQYETFLDITGEEAIIDAVGRCWASLDSPRIRAYLTEHNIECDKVAMAVAVQKLVPADVAGVLFTANPHGDVLNEMLIEASWGLGESVVSGSVQPDVVRINRADGAVLSTGIGAKQFMIAAGNHAEQPVEAAVRAQACLKPAEIAGLYELAKKAEAYFGGPQDLEWAIHGGKIFLLQSRPITTFAAARAAQELLVRTREILRQKVATHGPWVLHNLNETIPHATPLTWSIISRFMSGAGGFGSLYRSVGFEPAAAVRDAGFVRRIAGRIYMDCALAPEFFFENFPFAYDPGELKRNPQAAQDPPTLPKGTIRERMRAGRRLAAVRKNLVAMAPTLDAELRAKDFTEMEAYVKASKKVALAALTDGELLKLWREHEMRVLEMFAPRSLLPGLIGGMALADLQGILAANLIDAEVEAQARQLSVGGPVSLTLLSDEALYHGAKDPAQFEHWLTWNGHRAPGEFELSTPRWRETPAALGDMARRLAAGENPQARHTRAVEATRALQHAVREKIHAGDRAAFDHAVDLCRRYVTLREDAKDFFMLGYDLFRDLALEAGRRMKLAAGDVFYLTRDEIFGGLGGGAVADGAAIGERRTEYAVEERLHMPHVIDAAAIETLGSTPAPPKGGGHRAFGVWAGSATGPAKILRSPNEAGELAPGYVLVCPSTDPSWTPLFVNASALVLECGGALSHGAVVAREMGLPAVVLPDATRMFTDGEALRVDGGHGWVGPAADAEGAEAAALPEDTSVARRLMPPAMGRKERRAARLRYGFAGFWVFYLLAFFFGPGVVKTATMGVMDMVLWPLVRGCGKPGAVAIIAGGLAALTLILQRLLTDNARLLEAKRRANVLRAEAKGLDTAAPRRAALERVAASIQPRLLAAALTPVGILLGPLVINFVWLGERVDPAVWNAPPGTTVQVVADVSIDRDQPITLQPADGLTVDESTPAKCEVAPLRGTLEKLLALYRSGAPVDLPAANLTREQTASELAAFLAKPDATRPVAWTIHTPGTAGAFYLTFDDPAKMTVYAEIVTGDAAAPAPLVYQFGNPRIRAVHVVYATSREEKHFWRPLVFLEGRVPHVMARVVEWDMGWLGVYVLAYLPALLVLRRVLRLP